jgi:hypothetical protein
MMATDAIEAEPLQSEQARSSMPFMRRVKTAAEEADP